MFRLKAEVYKTSRKARIKPPSTMLVTHAAWGHAAYTISIVGRVTDPAHSLHPPTQMPEVLCDPAGFVPKSLQSSVCLPK